MKQIQKWQQKLKLKKKKLAEVCESQVCCRLNATCCCTIVKLWNIFLSLPPESSLIWKK